MKAGAPFSDQSNALDAVTASDSMGVTLGVGPATLGEGAAAPVSYGVGVNVGVGEGVGVGVAVGVAVETSIGVGAGVSEGVGLCPSATRPIRNATRANPRAKKCFRIKKLERR